MKSCCETITLKPTMSAQCPSCQQQGKAVPMITLKALLQPTALETIRPEVTYTFCPNKSCDVVYFSGEQIFGQDALKVPVFQKDIALDVPVCYCFGWTRERIIQAIHQNTSPVDQIREQVQAKRCGCDVNNPQGTCCLGNVIRFVTEQRRKC